MAQNIDNIAQGANKFSRRWTSNEHIAEPLITGYFFIKFNPPSGFGLDNFIGSDYMIGGKLSNSTWANVLESSLVSFTIPGATVNKAEFNGLGGIKWFYPTSIVPDDTISMNFTEWAGAAVHKIFHRWVKNIKDYRTGVQNKNSAEDQTSAIRTGKTQLTTAAWYWTSTPDATEVDFAAYSTGMFPMKDPTDSFSYDINTVDKLEISIDFSVDVVYQEKTVYEKCKQLLNDYANEGIEFGSYQAPGKDNIGY